MGLSNNQIILEKLAPLALKPLTGETWSLENTKSISAFGRIS
jgi:hypothetical protein